ncbi:MAG: lysine--tRNA ligase, partial [Chloroflexi bacterium]|nr:lysine--tRNA ligase [Chloroflexota bacterium]
MPPEEQSASRLEEIRAGRIAKVAKLRELGIDPYPTTFEDREPIADAREKSIDASVRIAGRIVLWRRHGGSTFAQLRDESGQLQIQLRKDIVGEEQYKLIKLLDVGDFLGVSGKLFTTKTGELTVG